MLIHVSGGEDIKPEEVHYAGEFPKCSILHKAEILWGARVEKEQQLAIGVISVLARVEGTFFNKNDKNTGVQSNFH